LRFLVAVCLQFRRLGFAGRHFPDDFNLGRRGGLLGVLKCREDDWSEFFRLLSANMACGSAFEYFNEPAGIAGGSENDKGDFRVMFSDRFERSKNFFTGRCVLGENEIHRLNLKRTQEGIVTLYFDAREGNALTIQFRN